MSTPGRVHRNAHDTELAAAESVRDVTGRLRIQVLNLLREHPAGLTDDEGGALMDGDRLTFGRRRQELVDAGLVKKTDLRRLTPRGRNAIVWQIDEAAA
jgi:hypothetical protein